MPPRAVPSAADVLAVASHELRSPLTSLVGFATTLRDHGRELSGDEIERCAAAVERQATKVARMVEDLLAASMVDAGGAVTKLVAVDSVGVVRDALDDAPPTRHEVIVFVGDDVPAAAGDPDHLRRVVVNLLTNATRYSRAGSRIDVSVEATADRGAVCISVRDQGRGIAPADQERMFGRYERGRGPGRGSCGLGLYVVRQLTEAMGGAVTVASELGVGSTFAVTLPVWSAAAPRLSASAA